MGGRFGAEGHRPILILTPEIIQGSPVTLALCINLLAAIIALGVGAMAVLAGSVGLALGKPDPFRIAIGEPLFLRCAVATILIGLALFFAGSIAAIRLSL